jgi:hypothetical protein
MAFKVCGIDRMGTNAMLYNNSPWSPGKDINDVLYSMPELAPYFPVYSKGATIHAVKGSAGIFCFKSKKTAKEFMRKYRGPDNCLLLKVKGIKTVVNPRVLTGIASCPMQLTKKNGWKLRDRLKYYSNPAKEIPGLVCFESVKVLE